MINCTLQSKIMSMPFFSLDNVKNAVFKKFTFINSTLNTFLKAERSVVTIENLYMVNTGLYKCLIEADETELVLKDIKILNMSVTTENHLFELRNSNAAFNDLELVNSNLKSTLINLAGSKATIRRIQVIKSIFEKNVFEIRSAMANFDDLQFNN